VGTGGGPPPHDTRTGDKGVEDNRKGGGKDKNKGGGFPHTRAWACSLPPEGLPELGVKSVLWRGCRGEHPPPKQGEGVGGREEGGWKKTGDVGPPPLPPRVHWCGVAHRGGVGVGLSPPWGAAVGPSARAGPGHHSFVSHNMDGGFKVVRPRGFLASGTGFRGRDRQYVCAPIHSHQLQQSASVSFEHLSAGPARPDGNIRILGVHWPSKSPAGGGVPLAENPIHFWSMSVA